MFEKQKTTLLIVFCLFVISVFIVPVAHANKDVLVFTKKTYEQMTSLTPRSINFEKKAYQQFKSIFNFQVFYARVARNLKEKISPAENTKLQDLFKKVFFKAYKKSLKSISDKKVISPEYHIDPQSNTSKEQPTIINVKGLTQEQQEKTLSFYIQTNSNNTLQLVDLAVEGALLSRNYRSTFNRIYREQGFQALYERLKKKNKELITY